jgi:hypothetical protein
VLERRLTRGGRVVGNDRWHGVGEHGAPSGDEAYNCRVDEPIVSDLTDLPIGAAGVRALRRVFAWGSIAVVRLLLRSICISH